MKPGTRSATADFATLMRAAHYNFDPAPRVLDDFLALSLSGLESTAELEVLVGRIGDDLAARLPGSSGAELMRDTRAAIAVRSRIAEDQLLAAVARGVRQYVVLGAGLDSSTCRLAAELRGVTAFEVDFPASQDWKRSRLDALGLTDRDRMHFVSIDFEQDNLSDRLVSAGFNPEQPAFFSWLGVVWYLSEEAVLQTLKSIAATAPGSEIAFEYPVAAEHILPRDRPLAAMIRVLGASRGEPVGPGFDPVKLTAAVYAFGFDSVTDISYEEIQSRYFDGRSDGLRMPGIGHFMIAKRSADPA